MIDTNAGGCRLMAIGEARRGGRELGMVSGNRRPAPERKVARQARRESTEATSQGAHGGSEIGEAGGGRGRGWGR